MRGALAITNATIWTGDPQRPWAESIAIRDGRVESLDAEAAGARQIDAGGRFVMPGFIDAHMHLLLGGLSLDRLDLSRVRTREEFELAIARRHRELPEDEWLIAFGWTSEHLGEGKAAEPDKSWLASAGGRPVVCYRMDHHAVLVNDVVLARCDLSAAPPTGRIVRSAKTGEPTGVLLEAAAWELVNPIIPEPSAAKKRAALQRAQQHCHALGITTVGSMEYIQDVADVFVPNRASLTLRCRVTVLDRPPMVAQPPIAQARSIRADDQLAIIGFKSFLDGTLGSRTARMLGPYMDDPGNRGLLVELAVTGELTDWVREIAGADFSPSMHAIGDEAVRLALNAIDDVADSHADLHARIEHVQHIAALDITRFRGRIASMQPLHKADDATYAERFLEPNQLIGMFAFRSLLEAGATLAFGSDWPIVSCDPIRGLAVAITGRCNDGRTVAPHQNLTVEEALAAYTRDAAFALRSPDAGILEPGAVGDVIVLDKNPFDANWIDDPPNVATTFVGGEVVYDSVNTQ